MSIDEVAQDRMALARIGFRGSLLRTLRLIEEGASEGETGTASFSRVSATQQIHIQMLFGTRAEAQEIMGVLVRMQLQALHGFEIEMQPGEEREDGKTKYILHMFVSEAQVTSATE